MLYAPTKPSSQRTSKITVTVQSISTPGPFNAAICGVEKGLSKGRAFAEACRFCSPMAARTSVRRRVCAVRSRPRGQRCASTYRSASPRPHFVDPARFASPIPRTQPVARHAKKNRPRLVVPLTGVRLWCSGALRPRGSLRDRSPRRFAGSLRERVSDLTSRVSLSRGGVDRDGRHRRHGRDRDRREDDRRRRHHRHPCSAGALPCLPARGEARDGSNGFCRRVPC